VIWHADGRFTRLEGAPCDEVRGDASRELAAAAGINPPNTRTDAFFIKPRIPKMVLAKINEMLGRSQ
jgi:hypothetical protein